MNKDDALYGRLQLGTAFDDKPKVVRVKARGHESESHWVNIPVNIFRQMLDVMRGNEVGKALPQTFMDGEVIMAARIPVKPGLTRHQALIVREYEDEGETLYSVHYLVAQRNTDAWEGDQGEYGIRSREEAFDKFTERMYRRGALSRNRPPRD